VAASITAAAVGRGRLIILPVAAAQRRRIGQVFAGAAGGRRGHLALAVDVTSATPHRPSAQRGGLAASAASTVPAVSRSAPPSHAAVLSIQHQFDGDAVAKRRGGGGGGGRAARS